MHASQLKKYAEIVRVVARHGGADLLRHKSFEPALNLAFDGAPPAESSNGDPEQLARDLEALGPTFIKVGQLLSTRPDVLPIAYLEALARLQDQVEPFPFKEVQRIIAEDFGRPLSRVFKRFDAKPMAAASLAQVHRARLPNGRDVAVKVQRPHIRERMTEDLEVLAGLAGLLDKNTDAGRKYEFGRMLTEFRKTLLDELDFRQEAQNMTMLAANLADFEQLVVTTPVAEYTTARILTMDYVAGKKIADPSRRTDIDGPALADDLFAAYLQQMLIDGFFHADPHPGNVIVTNDGRLALLDVGMVGRVSPPLQEDILKLMLAASEGEADVAADIAVKISEIRTELDQPAFRHQIADVLMRYRDASLKQIPVGRVMVEITRIAVENGLRVVPELTMLAKTLLNLDEVGRLLDPEFDPNGAFIRHAPKVIQQRLTSGLSTANIFTTVLETKEFVQALPARANRILDALSRNDLRLKVEMIDEGAVIDGLQKVANRVAVGLILAALILGAALLMRIDTPFKILGYPGLAMLFFVAAAGGGLGLALTITFTDRMPGWRFRSKHPS